MPAPLCASMPGRALAAGVLLTLMSACATDRSPQLELTEVSTAELLEGCADCPSEEQLRKAVRTREQLAFVQRVNALETQMTGLPLAGGNRVTLLLDGPDSHDAQIKAIARARHHVHLITYIMTDDTLARRYLDAMAERARRGVKVRLMYDAVGGRTVSKAFRQALADARIEVREFGPMNPLKGDDWSTTRRHHRKILVVDGRIAFTGGINISDEYRASSSGTGEKEKGWRDTHVSIEGPAVAQFQQLFFDSWQDDFAPIPPDDRYWPKLRSKGPDFVRAVQQTGVDLPEIVALPVRKMLDEGEPSDRAIYGSYLAAMSSARKRIWITQAYFIPNDEFLGVLRRAAQRKVDVRILVPSQSDIAMMVQASRFHYQPLLEAGARIWEYSGPMLHAKTAVVDGVWATVGSSNIDFRSFLHNDEVNATVIGANFGSEMEAMFLKDIANAREITLEEWRRRPWSQRFQQRMSVLLKYWI